MSKKRASRNNKKVLKALKQKRAKYNLGSIMRDRVAFVAGDRRPSKYRDTTEPLPPRTPPKEEKRKETTAPPVNKLEPVLKQSLIEAAPSGQFGVEAAPSQVNLAPTGAGQQPLGKGQQPIAPTAEVEKELQRLQEAQSAALSQAAKQGKTGQGTIPTQQPQQLSNAQTEQLKKVSAEATKVMSSPEYQSLLKEYENTKGDPKILGQLESMMQPFEINKKL